MKPYLILLAVLVFSPAFAQFGSIKEQTERAMRERQSREDNQLRMERLQDVVPAEGLWLECTRLDVQASKTLVIHGKSRTVWQYYAQGMPLGYVAPTQSKGSGYKHTVSWDDSVYENELHLDTLSLYSRKGARAGEPRKCKIVERHF
jgi:hypothetical protein